MIRLFFPKPAPVGPTSYTVSHEELATVRLAVEAASAEDAYCRFVQARAGRVRYVDLLQPGDLRVQVRDDAGRAKEFVGNPDLILGRGPGLVLVVRRRDWITSATMAEARHVDP